MALFTIAKHGSHVGVHRQMNEEDVVYLYNGTLHSHKKEWNHAICNNMDGPRDYHTKWSKPQGEWQIHMISLICGT